MGGKEPPVFGKDRKPQLLYIIPHSGGSGEVALVRTAAARSVKEARAVKSKSDFLLPVPFFYFYASDSFQEPVYNELSELG